MTKLRAMIEGGARLAHIKQILANHVQVGVTPLEIDTLADKLIKEGGDQASFKMEKGYHHATCINVNEGMVHGIPNNTPFAKGDVVKIDIGLFHQGFHTDTATTVYIPPKKPEISAFLQTGQIALKKALQVAIPGSSVYDIGEVIEKTIHKAGYSVIRDLTGHGIGRKLHMDPYIPCFADPRSKSDILYEEQTVAIEIMYAMGSHLLVEDEDGWTLRTKDRSVTGYYEDTVYISPNGAVSLTSPQENTP